MDKNLRYNIPILFIVFNRPETTYQVFSKIKDINPTKLFIAADGPRKGKLEDEALCNKVRLISKDVDWDCDLQLLYHNQNLGCGKAVSSGINWFFNNVKHGIILEDDCLPNNNFFKFHKIMLNKYKNEKEIMQINSFNPFGSHVCSSKYFKTIYPRIWGWSSWRDRWDKYSYEMDDWEKYNKRKNYFLSRYSSIEKIIRNRVWKRIKNDFTSKGDTSTWDYQWNFSIMMNNGYCLQPESNLIRNIGFNGGTHFNDGSKYYQKGDYGCMQFPLKYDDSLQKKFESNLRSLYLREKFRL